MCSYAYPFATCYFIFVFLSIYFVFSLSLSLLHASRLQYHLTFKVVFLSTAYLFVTLSAVIQPSLDPVWCTFILFVFHQPATASRCPVLLSPLYTARQAMNFSVSCLLLEQARSFSVSPQVAIMYFGTDFVFVFATIFLHPFQSIFTLARPHSLEKSDSIILFRLKSRGYFEPHEVHFLARHSSISICFLPLLALSVLQRKLISWIKWVQFSAIGCTEKPGKLLMQDSASDRLQWTVSRLDHRQALDASYWESLNNHWVT